MKSGLQPEWSDEQKAAGEKARQAWEAYFSSFEPGKESPMAHPFSGEADAKIAQVVARHEAELMRYPNVVGVSQGIIMKGGEPSSESGIVVYVQRKVPESALTRSERLPEQIEGITVEVVEVGRVEAQ